jgi:diguanylate cyclase (GGDEF)-like protein
LPFVRSSPSSPRPKPRVGRRLAIRLGVVLVALAAVMILAGVWSLGESAEKGRRAQAADQLAVSLALALDQLEATLRELDAKAEALARDPAFQDALGGGDAASIVRLASAAGGLTVEIGDRRLGADIGGLRLRRELALTRGTRAVARVVASVPVDAALHARLAAKTPLAEGHRLLLVDGGKVVLGPESGARIEDVAPDEAEIGGARFLTRAAAVPGSSLELVAATPADSLLAGIREFQRRLLIAAFGSLAFLTLLGAVLGGPILRALGDFTRVSRAAETDALTGIANRGSFDLRLAVEARRARDLGLPLSLILFDIDHFKAVNDEHGHEVGDEVLRRLGALLQDRLRGSDFGARYGGEEFAVVLPDTDRGGSMLLAERLREAVSELRVSAGDGELTPTASFGVASFPEQPLTKLVAAADAALYEAKRAGRNRAAAAAV